MIVSGSHPRATANYNCYYSPRLTQLLVTLLTLSVITSQHAHYERPTDRYFLYRRRTALTYCVVGVTFSRYLWSLAFFFRSLQSDINQLNLTEVTYHQCSLVQFGSVYVKKAKA